jgi:hypothetical protein
MVNRVRFADEVAYDRVESQPAHAPEPAPHHGVRVVRDARTGALELDDSEAHRNSYPETDIAWRMYVSKLESAALPAAYF